MTTCVYHILPNKKLGERNELKMKDIKNVLKRNDNVCIPHSPK